MRANCAHVFRLSRRLGGVRVWVFVVMMYEDGRHCCVPVFGDSPAAGSGDLCDQLVGVKQLQQSSDFLALTFAIKRVRCGCEQLNPDVCIPESLNRMFAPHHRCDQFHVFLTCRIQTAMTSSVCAHRSCQSPHAFPRIARISGGRECVEVTPVRGPE